MTMTTDVPTVAEFRSQLVAWLDENDLTPTPSDSQDARVEQHARVLGALYEAGWMRWGWPVEAGGLGGPAILRAVVGEEIVGRRLADPGHYSMLEGLTPAMIDHARPALAAEMVPRLLSGKEFWCRGISDSGSESDLTLLRSLTTRAEKRGDGWMINGHKVRMRFAQRATRCILLTRTGPGHAGITAFFVDMDTRGIDVRPLRTMNAADELYEVDFDDVAVPNDRMLGNPGDGWQLAIDLLPSERSTCLWQRIAHLYSRFDDLVDDVRNLGQAADPEMGATYLALHTLRCRSLVTQLRPADGQVPGSDASIDKILLSSAEEQLYDTARDLLPGATALDDSAWRSEYLSSRASTICGTAETQRNVVAAHLLDRGGKSA